MEGKASVAGSVKKDSKSFYIYIQMNSFLTKPTVITLGNKELVEALKYVLHLSSL